MSADSRDKRSALFLTFVAALLASIIVSFYSLFPRETQPSRTDLEVRVYDYHTGEPLDNFSINMNFSSGKGDIFSASADCKKGVTAESVPSNITLPLSLIRLSFSGIWVLEEIVGERTWMVADGKWSPVEPQLLASNKSSYTIRSIQPSRNYNSSTLTLRLEFYVTVGRPLRIMSPERLVVDPRLKITPIFSNFVKFDGTQYAIIPVGKPSAVNFSITYLESSWVSCFAFDARDLNESDLVDLTSPFIRSLASFQTNDTRRTLDVLERHGFQVGDLYNKLDESVLLFEQAAQRFEKQDIANATRSLARAFYLFRDVYLGTSNAYATAMGWTPTLAVILLFFAFVSSRMVTERTLFANILFGVIFSLSMALFVYTQPGFILLVNFFASFLAQKPVIPLFTFFFSQGLQIILIIALAVITLFMFRDSASQTFGVSIRNLRRRKIKTLLAISTIVIVSAATMSLLTFTPIMPCLSRQMNDLTPQADNSLVIFRRLTEINLMRMGGGDYYKPLQPYELQYFLGEWVKSANLYGTSKVQLRRLEGGIIGVFNNVAVSNPEFMRDYIHISDVLGIDFLSESDSNTILIGSLIASQNNLTEGTEILVNDRKFAVKAVFEERDASESLREIDGSSFLFQVTGDSFIFSLMQDFSLDELSIYKVSIVLKDEFSENITSIAEKFLPLGLDFWETPEARYLSTYEIHVSTEGRVLQISSSEPISVLSGNWQVQLVPIAITSLILVTNTLGAIVERRSEIRTIFTIGASPTRIRFLFVIEGLTLGVTGGILGYVLGYGIAQTTGFLLPSVVQQNLMSGTPFTIAFSTALLSSLIGSLMPSGVSIKTAVPSGALAKNIDEILRIEGEKAELEVPIKLQREDFQKEYSNLLDDFLNKLTEDFSVATYRQIIIHELTFSETSNEKKWKFIVDCATEFQVLVLAEPNEALKVSIEPLRPTHWTWEHKHNLKILAPILRKHLLRFLVSIREKSPSS